eukprot:COSAG06_NODE_4008_length_4666_cov_3.913072_7_plen_176_part_00
MITLMNYDKINDININDITILLLWRHHICIHLVCVNSAALVMRSRSGPSSAGGGGGWTEQREAEGRAAALVRCGATWQGKKETRVFFAMLKTFVMLKTPSFYQDRLGTRIDGKHFKTMRGAFFAGISGVSSAEKSRFKALRCVSFQNRFFETAVHSFSNWRFWFCTIADVSGRRR